MQTKLRGIDNVNKMSRTLHLIYIVFMLFAIYLTWFKNGLSNLNIFYRQN